MLEVEPELVESAVDSMLKEGSWFWTRMMRFSACFYHSEVGVARRLKQIKETDSPFIHKPKEEILELLERRNKVRYDRIQREAIIKAGSQSL